MTSSCISTCTCTSAKSTAAATTAATTTAAAEREAAAAEREAAAAAAAAGRTCQRLTPTMVSPAFAACSVGFVAVHAQQSHAAVRAGVVSPVCFSTDLLLRRVLPDQTRCVHSVPHSRRQQHGRQNPAAGRHHIGWVASMHSAGHSPVLTAELKARHEFKSGSAADANLCAACVSCCRWDCTWQAGSIPVQQPKLQSSRVAAARGLCRCGCLASLFGCSSLQVCCSYVVFGHAGAECGAWHAPHIAFALPAGRWWLRTCCSCMTP